MFTDLLFRMSDSWSDFVRDNPDLIVSDTGTGTSSPPAADEAETQKAVIRWAWSHEDSRIRLLYSVPNEGAVTARRGAKMRDMGAVAGQPDLCLPVPQGPFGALYIELKHGQNDVTCAQHRRLKALSSAGNATSVCWTAGQARAEIEMYLDNPFSFIIDTDHA